MDPFYVGLLAGIFTGPFLVVVSLGFLVLGIGLWKGR